MNDFPRKLLDKLTKTFRELSISRGNRAQFVAHVAKPRPNLRKPRENLPKLHEDRSISAENPLFSFAKRLPRRRESSSPITPDLRNMDRSLNGILTSFHC